MKVAKSIRQMRRITAAAKASGGTVALAATMGALHAGHTSLIAAAAAECDCVVVSIFVNPTQFAPGEDFSQYPRALEADLKLCRRHGADAVFVPSVRQMYPRKALAEVRPGRLADTLCGRSRAGHFAGVCTVVAKLFNIVQPDRAYFGRKDYQQAIIIRRMTAELNFPIEIVTCPTVREADGLAISSRNKYLTARQRREAPSLYGSLKLARRMILRSHPPAEKVTGAMRKYLAEHAPGGEIDYIQLVNPTILRDVSNTGEPLVAVLAVRFGRTRLIDNLEIK